MSNSDKDNCQTLLSEAELAQRWKVSKRTVQRWRYEGRLVDWFYIGQKILFRLMVIEAIERTSKFKARRQ
jgi:hypothetical protein